MTPTRIVTLRRVPLALVVRTVTAQDLQVFLALTLAACPRTGRVWTTPLRLADELTQDPAAVEATFASLIARGHITLWSRSSSTLPLRCYELGCVLARQGEAPDNLPVERDP